MRDIRWDMTMSHWLNASMVGLYSGRRYVAVDRWTLLTRVFEGGRNVFLDIYLETLDV